MRQSFSNRQITPSLFDRLTDREPRVKTDLPSTAWEQIKDFKDAVARDLTNLLNVRRSEHDIPEEFEETNRSIAAYGIHDFTASPVDAEQMRRFIEQSVRKFEPRLSRVVVHLAETAPHRLDFRISAFLHVEYHSEPVLFDASLPIHSRRFQVIEGR
ncbi:MAG: type VI secretion system baseplate subunit TssE [Acidobacteriaceae bacterium]|nr:type VI secretion system baseplate subunit TssE [Acidobacteriaceae bacterium]